MEILLTSAKRHLLAGVITICGDYYMQTVFMSRVCRDTAHTMEVEISRNIIQHQGIFIQSDHTLIN